MFKIITFFFALGPVLLGLSTNSQTTRFIINPASSNLEIGDTPGLAGISEDLTDLLGFSHSMNVDANQAAEAEFECMFDGFGLAIIPDSAATGEQLCLGVQMCNADSLVSLQYSVNFNPAILQFDSIANINLPNPGNVFENSNNTDGWVVTIWRDGDGMGIDIPDTLAYELCFTVIGAGGEMDTISITDSPSIIEVTKSSNPGVDIGIETQNVPIVVSGSDGSAVALVAADLDGRPGDTVCVAVTTQNFEAITSFQYTFSFDETNLQYLEHRNFNSGVPNLENAINDLPMFSDTGVILTVYPNAGGMSSTLMDGDALYEVCFIIDSMATIGTNALVGFSDDPVARSASQMVPTTLSSNNGSVNIVAEEVDITVSESITNVLCNGDATGEIALTIEGGDGVNYIITWTGSPTDVSGLTTPTISNLEAGSYTVSITSGMRDFTETYMVTEPNALTGTTTFTNVTCNGDGDGTITLTPSGGTAPYTFAWSNGPTDQNLTNLEPDSYTVTITDANMCTFTVPTVTIAQPQILAITIDDTNNVSCLGGNDGAINTTVTGGNGGNTYVWSNTTQTTEDIAGLTANNYQVTVTDNRGCSAVPPSVTIIQPSTVVGITVDAIISANCNGGGSIFITPTGGNNLYTYLWNNGATSQDLQDVPAGGYTVTVTDNKNCSFTSDILIVESTPAIVIDEVITQPNCDSESNGTINLTVNGGTGDGFTFNWSNGAMTEDLTNLAAGDYAVTVTDTEDGCTSTAMYQLTNSINLTIVESTSTPAGCAGATNGSFTVQVNGGSGNYSYEWSNGQTTATLNNVTAGTYTVTVKDDSSNCTEEASFTVDSEGGIMISGIKTEATCSGAENGSIDITVSGAGANPTFLWNDMSGTQTEDINNITDGNYVVTVTSTDGQCSQTAAFTVGAGNGFEIELDDIVQATCDGADNGTVNVTVNGASGIPTYNWSNGETTQDIDNAEGGTTATVTITDGAGCVEIANYAVPSGNGFNIDLVSINNASCSGAQDGAIDIELGNAVLPLTSIEWNGNTISTEDLNSAPAGTYTVVIIDGAGCSATATYIIDNDGGISGSVQSVTNVSCDGSMDGAIFLNVLNASNNLSFAWSSSLAMGQGPVGLPAGLYSVTITDDDSGCTDIVTDIEIGNPEPITFTSDVEDASCKGEDDGTITISAMGGNGGFSYDWSHDDLLTGNVATGLSPGSYIVTIVDSRGCSAVTEGIIVNEPAAIIVAGDITNISGTGNNGAITIMATGGTGTYTDYNWTSPNGPLTGPSIMGLDAGTYIVTVTDDNGCTGTATFNVNAADALNPTLISVTNVTCFDGEDGAITINVTGGVGGYIYTWQGPTNIPNDVQDPTGLEAGTYNVTVTDAGGVMGILSSIEVLEPEELDYDLIDLLSVSCPGFMDGEVNINPTGGNGEPYTVTWNITPTPTDPLNPTGILAGNYVPTITDGLGCTVEGDNILVREPMAITITEELIDPSCVNGGTSGSIVLDVNGGTEGAGYTYSWDGPGAPFPSTPQLANINPGDYFVTVTDARGCTATDGPYTLEDPGAIFIQLDSVRHVRCSGIAEGGIFVTTSGGIGNLMPIWKNGQGDTINTSFDLIGLIGGSYTLCVTDLAGCSETIGPITIDEPQPITVGDIEIDKASASADDGEIRLITVDGGTPAYTFDWEGPNGVMQTTNSVPTISDIAPGEWRVTIEDVNGCTEVITDIIVLGSLNLTATLIDPTCVEDSNGSIELTVNAGTPPFEYEWSTPDGNGLVQFAPGQFTLIAGTYAVTVEDANSVIVTNTYILNDPAPIIVDVEITNQTGADCNGFINTTVSGGTPPYTYLWGNGTTTPDLFDICKGEYDLQVMDANGCIVILPPAIVTAGPLSLATFTIGGLACTGGIGGSLNAEVFGGSEAYTFTLTGPTPSTITSNDGFANFTGLAAGMYELTVTDIAGSTPLVTSFEIEETVLTIITDTIINNTGMSMCNGAVNISIDGGQLPYSYVWSNGATSEDVSNLCENQSPLNVVVRDTNGCIVQSQDFILIAGLTIDLAIENESCIGDADGSIIATVNGGNAPYAYEWSNGGTTPNLTGLTPGNYTLTVTDGQGRIVSESVIIDGSLTPITVTSNVTDPTGANADGAINLSVSGGAGGYDYQWLLNGMEISITSDITGLTAGSYMVVITDAFGCIYSETFNLAGEAIVLEFVSGNRGCPGQIEDLGTLQVFPSGGASGGYDYSWGVSGQNNAGDIIGGLAPGNYTVTVTDASGFTAVGTGTVVPLEDIVIDLEVDEVNGNVTSTVTGGTPPYSYQWNDPDFSVTRDLIDAPSGTYTLVVVDANDCVNEARVEFLASPCEKVRKVISPNNDGFNDEFIVSCANLFDIDLEIYNRWGQLEFVASSYSNNWVGTDMEGAKLPEGGYFYVIRYEDGEGQTQQIKGSLNIVY